MTAAAPIKTVRGSNADLQITKIFWNAAATQRSVQITLTRNYGGQNLGILNRMLEIAQKDFPEANLTADDVKAVALGGPCRKGMWGIEFRVPAAVSMPEEYKAQDSELILAGGL